MTPSSDIVNIKSAKVTTFLNVTGKQRAPQKLWITQVSRMVWKTIQFLIMK